MKNSFGNNIQVTLFGESHGEAIGVVIDGLAAGLALDLDHVQKRMAQRQQRGVSPHSAMNRMPSASSAAGLKDTPPAPRSPSSSKIRIPAAKTMNGRAIVCVLRMRIIPLLPNTTAFRIFAAAAISADG